MILRLVVVYVICVEECFATTAENVARLRSGREQGSAHSYRNASFRSGIADEPVPYHAIHVHMEDSE